MGMEQTVAFSSPPTWDAIRDLLTLRGFPVQLRMIDGQLAFADEIPLEPWTELRVGTPHGMITLRREPDRIAVVTWGNADAGMRQAWNALTWACAVAAGGQILTGQGPNSAEAYLASQDMPAGFRGDMH